MLVVDLGLVVVVRDQMKRRNAAGEEEQQGGEMNGWTGYPNSDLSPGPTPPVPRMRASRPKTVKQSKNGPLTPGPAGTGMPFHLHVAKSGKHNL